MESTKISKKIKIKITNILNILRLCSLFEIAFKKSHERPFLIHHIDYILTLQPWSIWHGKDQSIRIKQFFPIKAKSLHWKLSAVQRLLPFFHSKTMSQHKILPIGYELVHFSPQTPNVLNGPGKRVEPKKYPDMLQI